MIIIMVENAPSQVNKILLIHQNRAFTLEFKNTAKTDKKIQRTKI